MNIELWNASTGNLIGQVATIGELTDVLHDLVALQGEGVIGDLFADVRLQPADPDPIDSWGPADLSQLALPRHYVTRVYTYEPQRAAAGSLFDLIQQLIQSNSPPAMAT